MALKINFPAITQSRSQSLRRDYVMQFGVAAKALGTRLGDSQKAKF